MAEKVYEIAKRKNNIQELAKEEQGHNKQETKRLVCKTQGMET
jgi:hypothetical protein